MQNAGVGRKEKRKRREKIRIFTKKLMLEQRNESCSLNFHRAAIDWPLQLSLSGRSETLRSELSGSPLNILKRIPFSESVSLFVACQPAHQTGAGLLPAAHRRTIEAIAIRLRVDPARKLMHSGSVRIHSLFATIFHQPHKDHQLSAFR